MAPIKVSPVSPTMKATASTHLGNTWAVEPSHLQNIGGASIYDIERERDYTCSIFFIEHIHAGYFSAILKFVVGYFHGCSQGVSGPIS